MTTRFLLLLLLAVPPAAGAQSGPSAGEAPAVTAYHAGARQFIDGDIEGAASTVDAALAETPQDARLRALRELIRQQQEGGGGGGDNPDESDAQNPDQNAPPDKPSAGDEGDQESQRGAGDQPQDPPADGPGNAPSGQPSDGGGASGRPQAMSRAEAEALLDAVGGEERLLLRQLRREALPGPRPERDW